MIWEEVYGGIKEEEGKRIVGTEDDGFIVAGDTRSLGAGNFDVYLFKINNRGDIVWERTFGGSREDRAIDLIRSDKDYLLYGFIPEDYTIIRFSDQTITEPGEED